MMAYYVSEHCATLLKGFYLSHEMANLRICNIRVNAL
jgi:hypothetical protein